MTYALLQTSLNPPPLDALQRAFKAAQAFSVSAADAMFAADDAFGILARDLPEQDALNLAGALAAEEILVEVVPERELSRLPDASFFLSAQLDGPRMTVFNALEDSQIAPLAALSIIAVGYDQREVRVDLIFGEATVRFFTTLEKFHSHHSPEATGRFPSERLTQFVRELAARAPHARRNRGADLLLSANPGDRLEDLVSYPRPSAFIEEIVWLLWQLQRSPAATKSVDHS